MENQNISERKNWIIKTLKGGEVSITYRENDFFIKHGEAISQCPHEWFSIGGNIDTFNTLYSPDNQSSIAVGFGNPDTGLSLLHISINTSELENIKADDFLSKYLNIGKLDKEDCIF
jgi:hypothetical protein